MADAPRILILADDDEQAASLENRLRERFQPVIVLFPVMKFLAQPV